MPDVISQIQKQPPPNKEKSKALERQSKLMRSIVSGQTLDPPIILELVDEYGQVVADDDSSKIKISAGEEGIKLSELDTFTALNGRYELYPFSVIKEPNSESKLGFECSGIILLPGRVFPEGFSPNTSMTLSVPIRDCLSNERKTDAGQCLPCDKDQLNVFPQDKKKTCTGCDQTTSVCDSGDLVGPRKNFWRFSSSVEEFMECLNSESCAGKKLIFYFSTFFIFWNLNCR